MEDIVTEQQQTARRGTAVADDEMMALALAEARQGQGLVSPNPMVGCVLVKDGQLVGRGYHASYGGPHAEPAALADAGPNANGATVYVTLEPCARAYPGKRTPPCAPALIEAGVSRVVVAHGDPNPMVNGGGIRLLRKAGIEVTEGVRQEEARQLVRGFLHLTRTGMPYVILKEARTRDGFIAVSLEGERWFTSRAARGRVHQLRAEVDGVMIGRNAALQDDPALTVREVEGHNPVRIVLDSNGSLPENLNIFNDGAASTLLFTASGTGGPTAWGERIVVSREKAGLDLTEVLAECAKRGMATLLVEGGPTLQRSFMVRELAREMVIFTSDSAAESDVKRNPAMAASLQVPKGWHAVEERLETETLLIAQAPTD